MTVERWHRSVVDWYAPDGMDLKCPASVTTNNKSMLIEVARRSRRLSYKGEEISGGFYRFTADHDAKAIAYLHRRPDNPDFLIGNWTEKASYGLWSLLLDQDW